MKKKKKVAGTAKKYDGLILYSRQGEEQGMLIEGGNGEIIAWFFKDSNNLVSAETLMRWAKQAKIYERALKASNKKLIKPKKTKPATSRTKKKKNKKTTATKKKTKQVSRVFPRTESYKDGNPTWETKPIEG